MKEFLWGNISYEWAVNVTNGTVWENRSYIYTTEQTVDSANARYDVNNDDTVDIFDCLYVWNNRDGEASYNGIYDVSDGGVGNELIDVFDVMYIWNNKS